MVWFRLPRWVLEPVNSPYMVWRLSLQTIFVLGMLILKPCEDGISPSWIYEHSNCLVYLKIHTTFLSHVVFSFAFDDIDCTGLGSELSKEQGIQIWCNVFAAYSLHHGAR